MYKFKKCTAIALAMTLIGGTAVEVLPTINMVSSVQAAEIDDEFIVMDYKTGENISANRMFDVFNTPAVGEENEYIDELTEVKIDESTNDKGEVKKRVTKTTKYMAKDLLIPEDFVGLADSAKYAKYVTIGSTDGEFVHLYLIHTIVVETCTEHFGDSKEPTVTRYSVKKIPAGSFNLLFTKKNGVTYRSFVVNYKQTASKLNTTINYIGSDKIYKVDNKSGMIVVNNHTLQVKSSVDKSSTDELQYEIVESPEEGASESSLATIDKDGVLQTLDNGTAYLKVTHKNSNDYTVPVITEIDDYGNQSLEFVKLLPQYYPLYIVKENPAKEIKINKKYSSLRKGDKKQLSISVTPTFTTDEYPSSATDIFKWESSNTKVATVSSDGLITAKGPGETVITVMGENNLVKDSFVLKVNVPVSNLEFDQTGVQTYVGMTEDIGVTLKPNYSDEKIYWSSSDESIVKVKSDCKEELKKNYKYNAKIEAKKIGTATITAYTESGIKASVTVNVSKLPDVDFIKLMYNNKEIKTNSCSIFTGQTLYFNMISMAGKIEVPFDQIKVTISKGGSDVAKATINKQGLVTCKGISRGSLKLYFKSTLNPALKRTISVNIKRPADYVDYTINNEEKKSIVMFNDETAQIKAELKTKNVDGIHDDEISKYKSTNTDVAEVDASGKIKAKEEGSASIYARTDSSQEFKLVSVNVIKASKIQIKEVVDGVYNGNEKIGKNLDITVNVYDSDNKRYTGVKPNWELDNTGILSVTYDNKLRVNKLGTTVVTCKIGGVMTKFTVRLIHKISDAKYESLEKVELNNVVKPAIKLIDNEVELREGIDYTIDSVYNPVVGKNTTKVHGKGNYTGDASIIFYVKEHNIKEASVSGLSSKVYNGTNITLNPVLTFRGITLKEGIDYTVSYSNNKEVGVASVKFNGKGNYSETLEKTFNITPAALSNTTITVAEATYNKTKSQGIPSITVKFGTTNLRQDKDFTVKYTNNNKLGNATVTLTGIGNFTGSVSKTFKVTSKYPLKITVPASTESVALNGKKKLYYTVVDEKYVKDKSATYKSSNTKIVKVDSNGMVTGVAKGSATITIDAHGAKATVVVYVR